MLKKWHAKVEIVGRSINGATSASKFWARVGQNINSWFMVVRVKLFGPEFKFNLVLSYFFGAQHYMKTFSFGEPGYCPSKYQNHLENIFFKSYN